FLLCTIFFFHRPRHPDFYTLSLHDALPICAIRSRGSPACGSSTTKSRGGPPRRFAPRSTVTARSLRAAAGASTATPSGRCTGTRSEEHTSELQSREKLVCRLLLEKK